MFRRICAMTMSLLAITALGLEAQDRDEKKIGELKGDPEALFKKLDANGDDFVSKEEMSKVFEQLGKGKLGGKGGLIGDRIFQQLDTNKDDKLSLEEFKKLSELREKMGKGLKGKIDPEKLKQLRKKQDDPTE